MLGIRPELVVDNGMGEPWLPASFSTGWRRFAKGARVRGHDVPRPVTRSRDASPRRWRPDTVALEVMGTPTRGSCGISWALILDCEAVAVELAHACVDDLARHEHRRPFLRGLSPQAVIRATT
jgi:hypothetical protein